MTQTAGAAQCDLDQEKHAWQALRGWETLFGLSLVVTVLFVLAGNGPTALARAVALGLLGVDAAAYLIVGRPAIKAHDQGTRSAWLYWALILLTFMPATALVPSTSFLLFALSPQAFMMLRLRAAITVVVVLNLAPALQFFIHLDGSVTSLLFFAGFSAVALTCALVIGPWISGIIDQSAERAELIGELEASRAEVARLSAERGALAERERLAGEIHDTLAQGLTSIIMLVQAAEAQADPSRHLALAVRTARENLAEARSLIAALSPAPLDGFTLEEALRRVTARLGEDVGVDASFTVEGASWPLPAAVDVVLIRAAQESLANVRKHAAATSVRVVLEYGEGEVTLRVRDDGAGFDVAFAEGFGLRAMRTRVEHEGGTFGVDSSPGNGTTLRVTMRTPALRSVDS